jgi:hypothetical protein
MESSILFTTTFSDVSTGNVDLGETSVLALVLDLKVPLCIDQAVPLVRWRVCKFQPFKKSSFSTTIVV